MSIGIELDEFTDDRLQFDEIMSALPEGLNNAFVTSPHWNRMHTQHGLRMSALGVGIISICTAFVGLLLYTSNILVTLLALQVVIYSIATELTLLCIKGF